MSREPSNQASVKLSKGKTGGACLKSKGLRYGLFVRKKVRNLPKTQEKVIGYEKKAHTST